MPLVNVSGRYLYFAHVPKTGGTSVAEYLGRRFGPLSMVEEMDGQGRLAFTRQRQRGILFAADHLTAEDIGRFLPQTLEHSFAVVRDPLKRIVSQYRFQSGVSRASRLDFPTWLRTVLGAARQDRRVYRNHIRPQSDLVPADAAIFRLEDGFDPMVSWLDEVTGTSAPEVKVHHLLKSRKAADVVPLHRQDIALVAAFYRADYERFGYPLPDPQAHEPDRLAPLRALPALALARAVVWKQRRDWLR